MSYTTDKQCFGCFRVLADQTRLRIIKELQRGPISVTKIAQRAGVTQPTVSYHLRLLDEMGLAVNEKKGREVLYRFNKNYPCRMCGVFSAPIKV